jgi:flagellar biosynthesis protein FlhA
VLQSQVRIALGRQIVQELAGAQAELPVITLDPDLEQLLQNSMTGGNGVALEPGLAERLQTRLADASQRQEAIGEPAVLMVTPALRPVLSRFARAGLPQLNVLAWNEIPDNRRVRLVASVGR